MSGSGPTLLLYDPLFLEHDTGFHPECAARLDQVVAHLKGTGLWDQCEHPSPRDAAFDEITSVHDAAYAQGLERIAEDGGGMLDADTAMSRRSYDAAIRAAGAVLTACEQVLEGNAANACCLVRPPGHHALAGRAMGFCLLNNIAVAARQLVQRHGLERVLIFDWDVHHGNGTQATFYDDPSVLFVSLHRSPFYPGTGQPAERGRGAGKGRTINFPMTAGTDRQTYVRKVEEVISGACTEFDPQFVLVSAGFDAHRDDPIGGLGLLAEDYGHMTRRLKALADDCCGGRLVSTLEGGYNLDELARSVAEHVRALTEK